MTEAVLWVALKRALRPYGYVERREDSLATGVPDVLYLLRPRPGADGVTGQIELKCLPAWPMRPGTPVMLPHFTTAQGDYLARWWGYGGRAWLLARVGRSLLLAPGSAAQAIQRGLPRAPLLALCTLYADRGMPAGLLLRALVGPRPEKVTAPADLGLLTVEEQGNVVSLSKFEGR